MMHNNIMIGSFSFDVIKRMLDVLSEEGRKVKKTNLASKAGLNYNVCLRYMRMLNYLGWIKVNPEVSITEEGKRVCAKLLEVLEATGISAGVDDDDWLNNLNEKRIEHSGDYSISSLSSSSSSSSSLAHTKQSLSSLINATQSFSEHIQNSDNNKKKTIMIVDDDEDIARVYEQFLLSVGYEVRVFIDSRSALHDYVSDPFLYDLLILDIRMQGIDGLQLYQRVKAINPECKAIFVSCLEVPNEVVGVLLGTRLQHIIQKPVSLKQFITVVKSALTQ
jgi:CheY-like chemotaxis protein/predicted transcriptional regulator